MAQSASRLRKIAAAFILVPLGVVIVAFAVANRQIVTVSFDPFSSSAPAAALTLPLFALVLILLVLGVIVGGTASWLRQGRWRRAARRLEFDVAALRRELEAFRRDSSLPAGTGAESAPPPERLRLQPPLR